MQRQQAEKEFILAGLQGNFGTKYDHKPKILVARLPDYPTEAIRRGIEGIVFVDLNIDKDGNVVSLKFRRTPDVLLTEAVSIAAYTWKFEPFQSNGVAVPALLTFRYIFRLSP